MVKKRGNGVYEVYEVLLGSRHSQVWVETVLYTLIGLVIIAALIAVVTPKVNNLLDKATLDQTTISLNNFNGQVFDTLMAPGNQRVIEMRVKRGEYVLDGKQDLFYFILRDSGLRYSEPGDMIKDGDVFIITQENTKKKYDVYLFLNYTRFNMNLTYQGEDINKTFSSAPTAYNLLIVNIGGADKKINLEPL